MKKVICLVFFGFTLVSQSVFASQQLPNFLEENGQETQNGNGWNFSDCGPVEDQLIEWLQNKEETGDRYVLTNACAYGRLPWKVLTQIPSISVVASELGSDHLKGIRAWKKKGRRPKARALRRRLSLFSGDCLNLEENPKFIEVTADKQAIAISGFNYLHLLPSPYFAACHLARDFDRLAPGGRAFYLCYSTNFGENSEIVMVLKDPSKYAAHMNYLKQEGFYGNQMLTCATNALTQIYIKEEQLMPGYINISVDDDLKENFANFSSYLKLSEQDIQKLSEQVGFNVINVGYSSNDHTTGRFQENEKGSYISFVLEKPSDYVTPEEGTAFERREELFSNYQDIDELRRIFHAENKFVVRNEYPFIFLENN
ncbi:MAG: hypothetical protein GY915_00195 [bacterium]|nr:hypothetical protein [bacterium]